MRYLIILTLLLSSCALIEREKLTTVQKIERIFYSKLSKNEVKEIFKGKTKESDNDLLVMFDSNFPDVLVLFDSENKVNEVAYYVYPKQLDLEVSQIECEKWAKKEQYKTFNAHSYNLVKEGRCADKSVEYKYIPRNSGYEIRWKK